MTLMQSVRGTIFKVVVAAIAIVFVVAYLRSCAESRGSVTPPASSAVAPKFLGVIPASPPATVAAAQMATIGPQNFPGCPVIPPSAHSGEMRAMMAQCGRAADARAAQQEAQAAAQSEQAWADLQKRDADALASVGVPPATTSAGATIAAAPATSGTTALPLAVATPPPGIRAGMVAETVQAQDQFGQWITLDQRAASTANLSLTTPPTPAGASGTHRTVWDAWIKTARPVQTVTLHVAGGAVRVTASVDAWAVEVSHSDAWTTAPSQSQKVITLAAGWHRVIITADQLADAHPARVELQLGSANVDPVIPVPWALPHLSAGAALDDKAKPATPVAPTNLFSSGALASPASGRAAKVSARNP